MSPAIRELFRLLDEQRLTLRLCPGGFEVGPRARLSGHVEDLLIIHARELHCALLEHA